MSVITTGFSGSWSKGPPDIVLDHRISFPKEAKKMLFFFNFYQKNIFFFSKKKNFQFSKLFIFITRFFKKKKSR